MPVFTVSRVRRSAFPAGTRTRLAPPGAEPVNREPSRHLREPGTHRRVIAEGVETTAQAAFLLNHKCEEAQGYLYAKPLQAAEFEAYLRSHLLAGAIEQVDKSVSRETKFPRHAAKPSGRRAPGG